MRTRRNGIGKIIVASALMLGLISFVGVNNVYANESDDQGTATVTTFEELKAAFLDEQIDTIYVADDIMVPCGNSDFESDYKSASAALVADRDLTIEGLDGHSYTLTRYVNNESDGYAKCRSMIEVYGDGNYDGIKVSIKNLVLDGGADWGTTTVAQRHSSRRESRWSTNTGYAGRAIIDVANKGTINLEYGTVLRNAQTSVNSQTRQKVNNVSGSSCYGAGIRIEYSDTFGGGTANLKMGAVIEDCSSVGWGGAIGAYNYGRLNIYGGTIRRCSSAEGAAICCTYRSGTPDSTTSTMKMYGGTIEDCVSTGKGIINIDGSNPLGSEFFGGIFKNCDGYAINVAENATKLSIADFDGENIQISGVTKGNFVAGNYTAEHGIQYRSAENITFTDAYILLFYVGDNVHGNISVEKDTVCGESFPGDPVKEGYRFNYWVSRDGAKVDADTIITKNQVLTADMTNLHEHADVSYDVDETSVTANCNGTLYPKNCDYKKVSVQFANIDDAIYAPDQNVSAEITYKPSKIAWETLTGNESNPSIKYEVKNSDGTWKALGDKAPINVGTYRASAVVGAYTIYSNEYTIKPSPIKKVSFEDPAIDVAYNLSDYEELALEENAHYKADIAWYNDDTLCGKNTYCDFNKSYTAKVTFTADENYCFDEELETENLWKVDSQIEDSVVLTKTYKMRRAQVLNVASVDEITLNSHELYFFDVYSLLPDSFDCEVEMVNGSEGVVTGPMSCSLRWEHLGTVDEDGTTKEGYNAEPNGKNAFEWELLINEEEYDIPSEFLTGVTTVTNGEHEHTYVTDEVSMYHTCAECGVSNRHYIEGDICTTCKIKTECLESGHCYEAKVTEATTSKNGLMVETCINGDSTKETILYYPKTVSLSSTSCAYTGKANCPTVKVLGADGNIIDAEYYDVSYSKNTAIGTATVTIKFKYYYEGTLTKTFSIVPPATKITSLSNTASNLTLKWNKVASATGYMVYRSVNGKAYTLIKTIKYNTTLSYTDTGATTNGSKYQYKVIAYKTVSGKTYKSGYSAVKTMYRLTRPTIKSATNSGKGKITVKWNKNSKASGYQVKVVNGSTTKTYTVSGASSLTKSITKLKKGKTYKVYVRSYKKVGSTTYYSAYTAAKSVKIKK